MTLSSKGVPDVRALVPEFLAYYQDNPSWGALHVVLDDGNWDCAQWCLDNARAELGKRYTERDVAICELAVKCSQSQLGKLARLVREATWVERKA